MSQKRGDSIRRIDILEFDKCMDDGNAIKRCFPGCSSKEIKYYVKEVLEEAQPDTMIIHVGANDITKSQSSEKEIAQNVIKIVNTCRNKSVNKIIVSASGGFKGWPPGPRPRASRHQRHVGASHFKAKNIFFVGFNFFSI